MKPLLTRRPAAGFRSPHIVGQQGAAHEGPVEDVEYVGGWSTGARANTSALIRWAVWGLLVLGPVLGAAAFVRTSATDPTPPVAAASAPTGTGSQGAAGFATLFVAQFLTAGRATRTSWPRITPPRSTFSWKATRTDATASS
ncbi:hypothetical protein ACFQ0G_53270 [Streptomyces chiangmaiensis]